MLNYHATRVTKSRITRIIDTKHDSLGDVLKNWDTVDIIFESSNLVELQYVRASDYVELKSIGTTCNDFVLLTALNFPYHPYTEVPEHSTLKYVDGWSFGFGTQAVRFNDTTDQCWPDRDLLLTSDFVDPIKMAKNNLAVVNGLVLPMNGSTDGLHILNGVPALQEGSNYALGFLDFSNLGEISYFNITQESRLFPEVPKDVNRDGIYVKLPDAWRDRTVGLVILGHLHLLDSTYSYIDDGVIKIRLKELDIPGKLLRNFPLLDIPNVPEYLRGDLGRIDLTNETLIEYILTQTSTFLFSIDCQNVHRHETLLASEDLPGVFSTDRKVTGFVQYTDGIVAEYSQELQLDRYCIRVPYRPNHSYLNDTTDHLAQRQSSLSYVSAKSDGIFTPNSVSIYKE